MKKLRLSVVIPARNEESNIGTVLSELTEALAEAAIPYELILVNDNSTDGTAQRIESLAATNSCIRVLNREPPAGFGRAIRAGLSIVTGDVVVLCMGDQSDDPRDVIAYYQKILEGYDCVFGSRFIRGAEVHDYPQTKLICNRIVNKVIQLLFWTSHNDMTNAFKAYRTYVIRECEPFKACHFNITIEMSLSALIRGYRIAKIPIHWYGRAWGSSKLSLKEMGRRYLVTLLKIFFDKVLIHDDVMAERMSNRLRSERTQTDLTDRISVLEERCFAIEKRLGTFSLPGSSTKEGHAG
jgi:dolichol-phosphate mannosyltransferase